MIKFIKILQSATSLIEIWSIKIPIYDIYHSNFMSYKIYIRRISPIFWNNNIQNEMLTPTNKRQSSSYQVYLQTRHLTKQKIVFSSVVLLMLQISTRIVGYPQCVLPFEIKSEKERKIYNTINVHVYMYFIFYISFLLFP